MARGLYRVYLYVVTIALAVFLTVSVGALLSALFRLTPLRGSYASAPAGTEITQTIVLALVTLIIVAGLGGLHYWLIRRDMASDPLPGASGVRAFTLNLAQGVATLVAVFGFASALSSFSLTFQSDIAMSLATSLAALGLALALGWERRRATPSHGPALIFERLRLDGVSLILALSLIGFVGIAVYQTERLIGQGMGAIQCTAQEPVGPLSGPYYGPCVGSELIGQWAALLLVAVVWLLYVLAGANGQRTLIRPIFLLLGFTAGVIALIVALERGTEYLLRLATSTPDARPDYLASFDVGGALVFAVLTLSVYGWRLRQSASHEPLDAPTTRLTMRAIGSALFAAPFWFGVGMLLNNLFITWFPGSQATPTNWRMAIAVAVAGVAYVPLALWLGSGSRAEDIKGPRRGFVLALLAAGALVTAGGAATLIYSVVTALLGVPLADWQNVARVAGAALIVGLALGGLYLWLAIREGQFTRAPHPEPVAPEAPAVAEGGAPINTAALDDVLAQLQQGSLSQAEAADRIRAMARAGALV